MPTPFNTSGLRDNHARGALKAYRRSRVTVIVRMVVPASLPKSERLGTLLKKFEQLHDGAHPLRIALDKLQTLDTVRIIEGGA